MRLHNRLIKADIWTSTDLIRILGSPLGLQLYQGMIQMADDAGCLEDDELAWKILLFPGFDVNLSELRKYADALINAEKLVPYEHDGKRYLWLKNFHRHQTLDYPAPPECPLPQWIEWHAGEKRHESCYRINAALCPVRISTDARRGFEVIRQQDAVHGQCQENSIQDIVNDETMTRQCQDIDKTLNSLSNSNSKEKERGSGGEKKQNDKDGHCQDNDAPDDVMLVMEHYNRVFKELWARPLKLTDDRRQKIKARLRSFRCEELCRAIDNIRASPFHCGDNDSGKVYATPEFIFRNDGQVDKWLKVKPITAKRVDPSEPVTQRHIPDVDESQEYLRRLREGMNVDHVST